MQSDIKIFVSRRLDLNSTIIPNALYIPVVCGATYSNKKLGKPLLGDNTGDNISELRNSFCELTVQYWAWKNIQSDYYGLCHYRRYLTFSSRHFKKNSERHLVEAILDPISVKKYDLLNTKRMRTIIQNNDAVVNESADVRKLPTPRGTSDSVFEHWSAYDHIFLDKRVLTILMETIKKMSPKYYDAAGAYMSGHWYRGYNCYVMRKELFFEMCEFQFPILFFLEKELAAKGYTQNYERTIGYLGEIMYGIFIYYLQQQGKYKIQEEQLVYFEQTVVPDSIIQRMLDRILFWLKFRFENIGFLLLPRGSKRRKFIKNIYLSLVKR